MEKYIQQLIDDIVEVIKAHPKNGSGDSMEQDDPEEVDPMADVEQFLYGPQKKLSEIVGIDKIQLPPGEKLSDQQKTMLFYAMTDLLKAYEIFTDFPEGLPVAIKYRLLRERWEQEEVPVVGGGGMVHIEFCHYVPEECPFPVEYCDCRKFQDKENKGKDNPF